MQLAKLRHCLLLDIVEQSNALVGGEVGRRVGALVGLGRINLVTDVVGEAVGAALSGGILLTARRILSVRCPVHQLPVCCPPTPVELSHCQ